MDFKVGDKVSWMGLEGIVDRIDETTSYPVYVRTYHPVCSLHGFTLDGRYRTEHTEPSLKLIERPKKMVKKKISVWVNVYENDKIYLHRHQLDAECTGQKNRIACVECVGEYEVEE